MGNLAREIRQFCSNHGLRLSTNLGQHFLIDESVLRTIVETADIQPTDHILEIGAGIGVLTKELLQRTASVTAIELDGRLIPLLKEYTTSNVQPPTFTIIQGNALETPFPTTPYKIVANIPYGVTSPLLRHAFLESPTHPTTMTLLIQREVAEKICLPLRSSAGAKGGDSKNSGLLTILVGLFGKPGLIRVVPPESFLPPPKVESAVLHIECFEKPLAINETLEEVFRLTKLAFGQRRKMLRNTIGALGQSHPGTGALEGMERLRSAGIDPTRRPQTLSVPEWIRLARGGLQWKSCN